MTDEPRKPGRPRKVDAPIGSAMVVENVELPPPGPLHCSFRVGEGGGKIMWAQRAYNYTIDTRDDQVVITVALRPANA